MAGRYEDWQRWWWGSPLVRDWPVGGFSNTWFRLLKWWRIRRLARNYHWLTDNLEAIPGSQLEAIGPWWEDFARSLGGRTASFAGALGVESGHFAAGLGSNGADFARGLRDQVSDFARGLGPGAADFLEGLGDDGAEMFLDSLGPRSGAFIGAMESPAAVLDRHAELLTRIAVRLGPGVTDFLNGLGSARRPWLARLGDRELERLVLGLGLHSSRLLGTLGDDRVLDAFAATSESLCEMLGPRVDDFMAGLDTHREAFVLRLGPKVRHLCAHTRQPEPIFRAIAAHPRRFAESLGDEAPDFAMAMNPRAGMFFAIMRGPILIEFCHGLGRALGPFVRRLGDPRPMIEVIASRPRELLGELESDELEQLGRDLGPHAALFGSRLRSNAYAFAQLLADDAPAFGRGLGRHARAFIRGLGGEAPDPRSQSWLRRVFSGVADMLRGNAYTRGFLRGLPKRTLEEWFEAIGESTRLRVQTRHRLRCSLCHVDFEIEETLVQCPTCATIVHKDCINELSRGRCPHDGEALRNFVATVLTAARDATAESAKGAGSEEGPEVEDGISADDTQTLTPDPSEAPSASGAGPSGRLHVVREEA